MAKKNKIFQKSLKEYWDTKAKMRLVRNKVNYKVHFGSLLDKQFSKNIKIGHPSAKIANKSMAKGGSKSNHVPSKGTKSSSETHLISVEQEKALSRERFNGKDRLKETHALERKKEVNDTSHPTRFKAMLGLVPKTTNRLDNHSDSLSPLNKGDTAKAKHNLDSVNLILENDEKRGFIQRNMGQFAKCMSKKRKEQLFEENSKALNDDSNVGVQVDNMSCEYMKNLKESRVTRKDEAEDGSGNHYRVRVEDDTISISKIDHAKVSRPSCVDRQCYSCSKPIDKPTWSGIFKTDDKKYILLNGHLSTKSCEKAWNLSKELLKVVEMERLSRLDVWPKAWDVSTPTGDDIGIYFFPHEMRQDKGLDQLVREVMENDLALRTIIGEAEVLIFPSILLPSHHQTFQRKHYLWGVFKRREDKGVVVEESLNAMGSCEKEKQQKVVLDQSNHMLLAEKPNQEMSQMAGIIPLERHMLSTNERTQEVEASHLEGPTNKGFDLKALFEGGQAEGALVTTDVTSFPTSHGQIHPSMGQTPSRLMGFVVRKTPKLDRIIREIEQEGALVFAMQGEMVGAGSWAVIKGTAAQK